MADELVDIVGLDHVQLAMPAGREADARAFYTGVLGLRETDKPGPLVSRGGCWFRGTRTEVHLGTQAPHQAATKAHPAFLVRDIEDAREALRNAGIGTIPDDSLPGVRRFYASDPFGNRLEFVQDGDGFSQSHRAHVPHAATRASIARHLQQLGVARDGVVMVHAAMRTVGPIVGGPDVLVEALLDALGPAGTVMMYVGWEDGPFDLDEWPPEVQRIWRDACPAFDPATSRARRGHGILAELLRTWPGARRSDHPEASIAAVGARAEWIAAEHPLEYGYGIGSPLARLVEAGGQVLLVGAPLDTVTLLHHAEHIARLPGKRHEHFRVPVRREGQCRWVDITQYNTSDGVVDAPYSLGQIAGAYLAGGGGTTGVVGQAPSHLLDAVGLVEFATDWLERRFG